MDWIAFWGNDSFVPGVEPVGVGDRAKESVCQTFLGLSGRIVNQNQGWGYFVVESACNLVVLWLGQAVMFVESALTFEWFEGAMFLVGAVRFEIQGSCHNTGKTCNCHYCKNCSSCISYVTFFL